MPRASRTVTALPKDAPQREPDGNRSTANGNQATCLAYIQAQCGSLFRRGFSLVAHREKLYVRTCGTKVPLFLDLTASWRDVQSRAGQLQEELEGRPYDPEAWRQLIVGGPKRLGMPTVSELDALWRERKMAEGITDDSYRRGYLRYLNRLDPKRPLGTPSLLKAIATTEPGSASRKRMVIFYRTLALAAGVPWNSSLLDTLGDSKAAPSKKDTPIYTDKEIEIIVLHARDSSRLSWWRALALMAIYGLRPWEAWIAVPSNQHKNCVWIPEGKKHSHGTNRPREVPPFHPYWIETFDMEMAWRAPLPSLSKRDTSGQNTNRYIKQHHGEMLGAGKSSYGFRNAYARRIHSTDYRVTDGDGAEFMGHTLMSHNAIYRRWVYGYEDPIARYM